MEFVCKLGTTRGLIVSQVAQAPSESELRQRLRSQGFYIFSVRPKQGLTGRMTLGRSNRIPQDDFLIFNQQFLTLSKSGLPLQKSLELLTKQTQNPQLKEAIEEVHAKVRAGALLSESFEAVGCFPKIYCATIRSGERSGSLDKVLDQYGTYQKAARTFRKKFLSALVYPAFLMVFLIALVAFVVTFIVPRFAGLYADLGVQLPGLTLFVISTALSIKKASGLIFLGLVGIVLGVRAAFRSEKTQLAWDRFKYRLPLAGKLLLKFSVAEFARTISTLLQGGIPIVSALETARGSVSSPLLSQAIEQAQKEVMGGRTLSSSLRMNGFLPPLAIDMIEVGENTGAMSGMLEAMADFFEEDVNIDLTTLVALVDPIMIAVIALAVAFVLVSFYLPLFSMAMQVH